MGVCDVVSRTFVDGELMESSKPIYRRSPAHRAAPSIELACGRPNLWMKWVTPQPPLEMFMPRPHRKRPAVERALLAQSGSLSGNYAAAITTRIRIAQTNTLIVETDGFGLTVVSDVA